MHIAKDFFEREQNGSDGSVESGCQGGGTTHGNEGFYTRGTQTRGASDNGSDAGSDLDGRTFAPERNAAGQRYRTTQKLAQHSAQGDETITYEDGELGLGNSAAACIGEVAVEQDSRDERAEGRDSHAPPGSAVGRVHPGGEASGDQKKSHNGEADNYPDHQTEKDQEAIFTVREKRPAPGCGALSLLLFHGFSFAEIGGRAEAVLSGNWREGDALRGGCKESYCIR